MKTWFTSELSPGSVIVGVVLVLLVLALLFQRTQTSDPSAVHPGDYKQLPGRMYGAERLKTASGVQGH